VIENVCAARLDSESRRHEPLYDHQTGDMAISITVGGGSAHTFFNTGARRMTICRHCGSLYAEDQPFPLKLEGKP